ncbi:uncharacterized, partial [Tachysurus ichikawai]
AAQIHVGGVQEWVRRRRMEEEEKEERVKQKR